MKFKKEFGLSEIVAVAALAVSVWALVQSYKASNPYLIFGINDLRTMAYSNNETCNIVVSFSVEFNNSGQRGTSLQRLASPSDIPPVMFFRNDQLVSEDVLPHRVFLLPGVIENLDIYWNVLQKRFNPLDLESPSFIQRIVSPNSSEKLYFVVDAPMSAPSSPGADTMFIGIDVDDDKGNRHEIRMALDTSDFPMSDCR